MFQEVEKSFYFCTFAPIFINYLISYKFTSAKADMKMSYNTLENNLKDNHHPKLEVMVRIARGLFPGLEEEIMPGLPRKLSSHLCRNEMMARIFAAFLVVTGGCRYQFSKTRF